MDTNKKSESALQIELAAERLRSDLLYIHGELMRLGSEATAAGESWLDEQFCEVCEWLGSAIDSLAPKDYDQQRYETDRRDGVRLLREAVEALPLPTRKTDKGPSRGELN